MMIKYAVVIYFTNLLRLMNDAYSVRGFRLTPSLRVNMLLAKMLVQSS
jgi:hypothetical protein